MLDSDEIGTPIRTTSDETVHTNFSGIRVICDHTAPTRRLAAPFG